MKKEKLLLIGKIPPPAGGIGIHLLRLMDSLELDKFSFELFDMDREPFYYIPARVLKSNLVHSHVSHPYLRFFIIMVSRILNKKVIFTFHGNVGRYNKIKNFIDKLSFYFANGSIVINQTSFEKVKKYENCRLIPVFIPPLKIVDLPSELNQKLNEFKIRYKKLYCTNANGMNFDKNKKEIYGILGLVTLFEKNLDFGLIISDPSSAYFNYFKENQISLPSNIYLIEFEHDFLNIICLSDCCIRATSTDGDSLSIKESLFYDTPVICSDVVDRFKGVILYKFEDWDDLNKKLKQIDDWKLLEKPESGYHQTFEFYKTILNG